MIPGTQVDSNGDLRRYETLLQMADLMVHHRSLPELFHELAERLQEVAAFEFASFSLHDPAKNMMVLHLFEDSEFPPAPALVAVEDSPSGWVWQNQQPLAMSDLQIETRFPLHLDILREKGFRSCCFLPMTTAQRRLGALALGSSRVDEYDEKDLRLLHRVAELVALAMENALTRWALQQEKAEREFRSDLYYRLNVFPIRMPPLRDREGDIALLVRYFVKQYARRMNKQIETIPTETMNALASWDWPGNVRELENFIERSVILTEGPLLNAPLVELRPVNYDGGLMDDTLQSIEREHIVRALRETGGVIAGLHGAALRLGLKRTTLQSRILKLGISREEYCN